MSQAGDVIIHAGAGTGYYSAILSQLAGGTGKVHAFEIDAGLAERATQNLAAFKNVSVLARSALETPLPPADVIYVCAGATHVPAIWLDTLTIGGRLVLPPTPNERLGCMLLVTRKSNDTYTARCFFSNVGFIPCIGARDDEQSRALAAALDKGSMKDVKSLHRNTQPDDSAWCIGKDWWLSTTEPQG